MQLTNIVQADPAVQTVAGFTGGSGGGGRTNTGSVYVLLKPLTSARSSADEVIARLRTKLAQVPGGAAVPAVGAGRPSRRSADNAQYQFTLQADKIADLYEWAPEAAFGAPGAARWWRT